MELKKENERERMTVRKEDRHKEELIILLVGYL